MLRRSACTEPDAKNPRPTLADALREAIRSACTELGLDTPVIIAPPAAVPAETEATQAELEWLAEWCDSHEAPQTITTEAAHAELLARACAMDEAGRSLVVGGSSGLMKLQQTQLLLAQVCAAERRVERADASLLLWRSELAEHRVTKQQRTVHANAGAGPPDHPRVAKGDPRGATRPVGLASRATRRRSTKRRRSSSRTGALSGSTATCWSTICRAAPILRRANSAAGTRIGGVAWAQRCVAGPRARSVPWCTCSRPLAGISASWTRWAQSLASYR